MIKSLSDSSFFNFNNSMDSSDFPLEDYKEYYEIPNVEISLDSDGKILRNWSFDYPDIFDFSKYDYYLQDYRSKKNVIVIIHPYYKGPENLTVYFANIFFSEILNYKIPSEIIVDRIRGIENERFTFLPLIKDRQLDMITYYNKEFISFRFNDDKLLITRIKK